MKSHFIPFLIIIGLFSLFFVLLVSDRDPADIKNVQVGRPVPEFSLSPLPTGSTTTVDHTILKSDETTIVNFFASWCVPCRAEHESLMQLAEREGVRLIGVAYKDKPADSIRFLEELGNPFRQYGSDLNGDVGIDFGITGVPESYIIDNAGNIRFHYRGPIVGDVLQARIVPELEKASR